MRLILLFSFVFLHHLSFSRCSDIKVRNKSKNNTWSNLPNFVNNIVQDSSKSKSLIEKIKTGQFQNNLSNTIQNSSKTKLTYKKIQLDKFSANENEMMNEIDINNQERNLVFAQISKEGTFKLESLGKKYKKHLNPNLNISQALQNVTEKYEAALRSYFNFMGKLGIKYGIDRSYYFLDIIEYTNKIFHIESKILFDTINALTNNSALEIDIIMLTEEKKKSVIEEKKDNIKYICENIEICRCFPGYSDHILELLNEILKLSDTKMKDFAKIFDEIVIVKLPLFNIFMNEEMPHRIVSSLKHFGKGIQGLRELFSILRATIIQRYKTFRSGEREITSRTKAIRILIDLVDKTFEEHGDDLIDIEFDNALKGLKAWTNDRRKESDIRKLFIDFSNNFVDIIKYSWDEVTREEVQVLFDVIKFGNSENNIVLDDLFAEGSNFVILHRSYSDLD